jgi:thiol-disulfide isomerase/thioredoxin
MSNSRKRIKMTLFHANWCGHCTNFMPTWESMKADKNANKNIEFVEHEESTIMDLPENERMVEGKDVTGMGYPTIRINVNEKEYAFDGGRTVDNIYNSIIDELRNQRGMNGKDNVTKTDNIMNLSTTSEDVNDKLNNKHNGGSKKLTVAKRILPNDFGMILNDI